MPAPFAGLTCLTQDTHVVVVGGGSAKAVKPDSLKDQAKYKFTARSGDFDSDGRTDVLIDRTTSGSVDGSMQSYILYQRAGGVVEAAKPTAAELKRARGFQTTSKLNLIPNDLNIDGFADHTIENLKSLMGSAVEDGHVVFAPGTAADKTKPSGDVAVTHEFTSFYADLAKWLNDPAHFAKNISITRIPVYGLGWVCGPGWSDPLFGFFPQSFCQPYIVLVGYATKVDGVSLSALAASTWIEPFLDGSEGPSKQDLWALSRIARSVLGVHLFGFSDDGELGGHNFDIKEAVEEATALFVGFVFEVVEFVDETTETVVKFFTEHDYHVETEICTVTDETKSWCTLENIACWGRHYPAPYEDESDHNKPIANGAESKLSNCMIFDEEKYCDRFGIRDPNPILTAVGTAGKLSEHAIANTTLAGHIFHDKDNPAECPKKLNDDKDWKTSTPNGCSQVYREPNLQDSKITMRTRGYGKGKWGPLNDQQGQPIFSELDKKMIGAINKAPDRMCPSQQESE